jgi:SagB-type dehydrogenase family enzyme
MSKLAWVLTPLAAYAVVLGVALARSRLPARHAINVHTSLLLMIYLLATAGLGIFWVANQQLPVFDWHYLFGYSTLLLVTIHLCFNLPLALRALRGRRRSQRPVGAAATARGGNRVAAKAALVVGGLAAAFFLGTRERATGALLLTPASPSSAASSAAVSPAAAVIRFHELSSESRASVFMRAPGIDWGAPPPVFKSYPDAPHLAFGTESSSGGGVGTLGLSDAMRAAPPRTRSRPLSMAELGDILFLGAGVTARRGGNALRAAPSSGALFSNELYVLARAVDGLAAGVYHYDPDRQRLDALGGLPAVSGAPSADDADAVVVATSVFRRTGYKYRDRAYRYVSADTGHLLENLRLAGNAAGMQAQPAARFDEAQLGRAIGVDGVEEGVLAVMALRRGGGATEAGAGPGPGHELKAGLDAESSAHFVAPPASAATGLGLTGAVQQATSLRLAPAAAPAAAPAVTAAALPPPQAALAPARRIITARRSQRRFGAEPVPLVALASILADMAQPAQLSDAIRVHVVVNRVDGLAPGVYRYRARHALEPQVLEPQVLEPVRRGDFAAQAQSAALSQEAIGSAAVVLVLSAGREAMLAEGARGYRQGFLEAGMIGERWLLGAVARGLSACPVGAFYDDEAAALIGVDRRREWVLHFAALGGAPNRGATEREAG